MKKLRELCEVCEKAEYTRLCDHASGTGVVTSIDFKEMTQTCDKKMCNKCATALWANCEVCPEHASDIRNKLFKEEPNC